MRRSLKIRSRRKEKEKLPSGITADYSASFFAELDRDLLENNPCNPAGTSWTRTPDGLTQSDSSEASLTSLTNATGKPVPPLLPPKPPKRGILKGPRLSITSIGTVSETVVTVQNGTEPENHHQDVNLLVRNTLQNEVIAYQNVPNQQGVVGQGKDEICSEEESSSYHVRRSPHGQHGERPGQQQNPHHHHHHHHPAESKLLQVERAKCENPEQRRRDGIPQKIKLLEQSSLDSQ